MKKMTEDYRLADWTDAEAALGKLAKLDAQAQEQKAKADEEINQVKGRLKTKLDSLEEQREIIEEKLREFAEERKAEFVKPKSRRLRFGTIGFRRQPKFSWPKKNETG